VPLPDHTGGDSAPIHEIVASKTRGEPGAAGKSARRGFRGSAYRCASPAARTGCKTDCTQNSGRGDHLEGKSRPPDPKPSADN